MNTAFNNYYAFVKNSYICHLKIVLNKQNSTY